MRIKYLLFIINFIQNFLKLIILLFFYFNNTNYVKFLLKKTVFII